jgi:hypothetical protein
MYRRTLLQSLAAALLSTPLGRLRLRAQAAPLGTGDIATLDAIAEVVLPAVAGPAGRKNAVAAFVAWVRNYKEGADRGYGYGSSTLTAPTGPSPVARYPAQFAALDESARARGGTSFAALALDARREIVEASLNAGQGVARLPARPTGANLIADFMGLYFNGEAAWNLAYRAQINRDSCRALEGSDRAPAPTGDR